jgi:hypothetical protein
MTTFTTAAPALRTRRSGEFCWLDNAVLTAYGPRIGAHGIAVYAALAMHASNETQACWPSVKRLASLVHLSRTTVKKTLRRLEAEGLLGTQARQDAEGDPTSNLYTLLDPPVRLLPQQDSEDKGGSPDDLPSVPTRPTGGSPHDSEPDPDSMNQVEGNYPPLPTLSSGMTDVVGLMQVEVEVEVDAGTALEPENSTSTVTKGTSEDRVQSSPKAFEPYTSGFLRVLAAYPEGYRGQQRLCFALWQDRGLESRAPECVEKIERLKIAAWPKREPRYRPSLHTWLARAYYDDELVPLPAHMALAPARPNPFDETQAQVRDAQCTDMAELMHQMRAAIGDRGEAA